MIPNAIKCAYFLDIDGTLVDLADSPHHVRVDRAQHALIDALYRSSDGAVALITGRALVDVDRLFPDRLLPAAGQHGLERRRADGRLLSHVRRARELDAARVLLARQAKRHPGLILEDKGLSLALHYRRAPSLASYSYRVLRGIRRGLGDGYRVHGGKHVVELVPAGKNKGAAIRSFMREQPFRGRLPIFMGDDVTDEYGFAVVNELSGWSIKVGDGRTVARWRLPDVRSVLGWLQRGRPAPSPVRIGKTGRSPGSHSIKSGA